MTIKVGDTIPDGTFKYIPYTDQLADGVSLFSIIMILNLNKIDTELLWNS